MLFKLLFDLAIRWIFCGSKTKKNVILDFRILAEIENQKSEKAIKGLTLHHLLSG